MNLDLTVSRDSTPEESRPALRLGLALVRQTVEDCRAFRSREERDRREMLNTDAQAAIDWVWAGGDFDRLCVSLGLVPGAVRRALEGDNTVAERLGAYRAGLRRLDELVAAAVDAGTIGPRASAPVVEDDEACPTWGLRPDGPTLAVPPNGGSRKDGPSASGRSDVPLTTRVRDWADSYQGEPVTIGELSQAFDVGYRYLSSAVGALRRSGVRLPIVRQAWGTGGGDAR